MTLLKKLDARESITASQLADEFSVTERSIYRYLETLQIAGYPIYFDRELKSYRFVESYKLQQAKGSHNITASLELKKQMLRSSSVGIAAYKTTGGCVLVNAALAKMLNKNRQQLLAQNFRHIASWQESGLLKIVDEVIADKKERAADVNMDSTVGKELWVHCIVTPFCSDGENFVFVMAHDISFRKQNELSLSTFATSISKSPSLIMITDTNGIIEYVSDKITDITGYSSSEVIGNNPRLFQSGCTKESVYENLWETITNGQEWTGELCNRRKSGATYWEHLKISPIFDANNIISRFVAIKEDVTRYKQLEDELYRHATSDALTGLYNRRMLFELADREIEIARRHNDIIAVILLDIDNLKIINHDFGHDMGDKVLTALSQACRQVVRKSDILGRTGDDEFAIVLSGVPSEKVHDTAHRLLQSIEKAAVSGENGQIQYSVSIGVALQEDTGDKETTFEMLLDSASQAANKAMRKTRNKIATAAATKD